MKENFGELWFLSTTTPKLNITLWTPTFSIAIVLGFPISGRVLCGMSKPLNLVIDGRLGM
jgi:hypothetical protein